MKSTYKLITLSLITCLFGCENDNMKDDITKSNLYILCEGNFGSSNATLWSVDLDETDPAVNANIYETLTGNNLGDIGQLLTINGDELYVIMNNSHTVEVLDISEGVTFISTIEVPSASPRKLEIVGDTGYLSCWGINGVLTIDLNLFSIQDTILLEGMPEDIVHHNGFLYVSMTMNTDWSNDNEIKVIDINSGIPALVDSFEVVYGPGQLIQNNNQLFAASIYYGCGGYPLAGMSKIDLTTGEVIKNDYGPTYDYGSDITVIDNQIYRTYKTGIIPLDEELNIDEEGMIGNYSNVYSMASFHNEYIVFGLSDYSAPDSVVVYNNLTGSEIIIQVGAIPGAFAYYSTK